MKRPPYTHLPCEFALRWNPADNNHSPASAQEVADFLGESLDKKLTTKITYYETVGISYPTEKISRLREKRKEDEPAEYEFTLKYRSEFADLLSLTPPNPLQGDLSIKKELDISIAAQDDILIRYSCSLSQNLESDEPLKALDFIGDKIRTDHMTRYKIDTFKIEEWRDDKDSSPKIIEISYSAQDSKEDFELFTSKLKKLLESGIHFELRNKSAN